MRPLLPTPLPLAALLLLAGCAQPDTLTVQATADAAASLGGFVPLLDDERVTLEVVPAPDTAGPGVRVSLELDGSLGAECFAVEGEGRRLLVRGDALGLQYGLAAVLEAAGYRFFHPWQTLRPETIAIDVDALERSSCPEMSVRGLQMHTLHPIEGYFDFWESGASNLAGAERVLDWLVKNRANHVQWVGLDDISGSFGRRQQWQEHTAAVLELAHARGLTASLGIQLFGSGNLQNAFDLLDDTDGDIDAALAERLTEVTAATPFDGLNLSFGEFFEEGPDVFIATIDRAWERLQEVSPGTWLTSLVHVGADLLVEYDGRDHIYYTLAQYADPAITPHVHTVMYYNLFDDPGGSYHHEDYDEHRALLLDRLTAGERVGYFPESAYWIAFDDSIPMYLPIYVKSRWRDLAEAKAHGGQNGHAGIDEHVLFSSGWEWGYWQTDVAVLRANWAVPAAFEDLYGWMWAPYGEAGRGLADALGALADEQYEAYIGQRLAAYVASKDSTMELGYGLGILSQPKRLSYDEIAELTAAERADFRADVVERLATHLDATWAIYSTIDALALPRDRFIEEVLDGVAIDAIRTEYVALLMGTAADFADGADVEGWESQAGVLLSEARAVVGRRHANLHDPDPQALVGAGENATIYQYGYLIRADELCFWERELVRLRNHVEGSDDPAPGCAL